MSDLFESLNFHAQWPPQCSPTLIDSLTDDRSTSLHDSASTTSAAATASVLRTPDQRADFVASFSGGGGSGGDGDLANRRDGRVFWYAPPSPSLQLQQAEQQKRMAASRLQPLASQAFREELLMTSASSSAATTAAAATTMLRSKRHSHRRISRRSHSNGVAHNGGQARGLHEALGIERIMSDLDQHLASRDASVLLDNDDDDSGHVAAQEQDKENLQRQLIEGMDRAFSQDHEREALRRRRHQQKVLCEAFENNDEGGAAVLSAPPQARTTKWSRTYSMPVRASQEARLLADKELAARAGPTANGVSPPEKQMRVPAVTRLGKRELPHSPSNDIQTAHVRRPNSISGPGELDKSSPTKPVARPTRTSPNKRCAVLASERGGNGQQRKQASPSQRSMARTVSDGAQHLASTCFAASGLPFSAAKTGTTATSVAASGGVKKTTSTPVTRGPRVGLSRTSTGPSASQATARGVVCTLGSTQSAASRSDSSSTTGPSAPFKQPTRRSPRKQDTLSTAAAAPRGSFQSPKPPTGVIVLDDSSDEEEASRRSKAKACNVGRAAIAEMIQPPPPAAAAAASTSTGDADSSFDTSLDEMALCEALEQVEASQEAMRAGRQQQQKLAAVAIAKPVVLDVAPGSDDSFASMADDDELSAAVLRRMDAEGW